MTAAVVLEDLRGVLRRKVRVPAQAVTEIESFLRSYHVQPKPRELRRLKLGDRNDLLVIAPHSRWKQKSWFSGTRKCSISMKNLKVCEL